jgi:hypothetical protein
VVSALPDSLPFFVPLYATSCHVLRSSAVFGSEAEGPERHVFASQIVRPEQFAAGPGSHHNIMATKIVLQRSDRNPGKIGSFFDKPATQTRQSPFPFTSHPRVSAL